MKKVIFGLLVALSALPAFAEPESSPADVHEYTCLVRRDATVDVANVAFHVSFNQKTWWLEFSLANGDRVRGLSNEFYDAAHNRTSYALARLAREQLFQIIFENNHVSAAIGGDPVSCNERRPN